jgi:CheY-like chemotaxis protein
LTTTDCILVADDQRDGREMLAEYLTHCGFVVHEAADGLEAIEVAVRVRPAIILMDLIMPQLDGGETTRRLKADERTRDITIIAVSACTSEDAQRVARHAGCDGFIPKPYDLPSLVRALRGALDRRSGSSDDARGPLYVSHRHGSAQPEWTPAIAPREVGPLSLADAIAADRAFDDAIAAALEHRTGRDE